MDVYPISAGKPDRRLRPLATLALVAASLLVLAPAAAADPPAPGCTPEATGNPNVTDYTCYVAPITVAGYEVKQDILALVPKPPGNGHVTRFETDVVDADGTPVPIDRLMLHHIVFSNLDRGDKTCTGVGFESFNGQPLYGGYAPERFAGAGEERAVMNLPHPYGYELNQTDRWALVYMLMNHRKQSDTAYIQYKLRVDDSGTLKPVRPYWLDVNNCRADPVYNIPGRTKRQRRKGKNAVHKRSRDFGIQENGRIVAGAGHVHGGARRLTITKPSCGNRRVAQSLPTWGNANHPFYTVRPILHEPGPIGMSGFNTQTGIPVRKGQKLRLNSLYDNTRQHTRVMGIYVVYVAADEPGDPAPQACAGAPADTQYGPGTNEQGRRNPVRFTIPLTGLNANGDAVTIKGPPGRFRKLRSGAVIRVGDRFFGSPSRRNVRLRAGDRLRYRFVGQELHNLTLANGPLGIGSDNLDGQREHLQRFTRPGTYRFFCGLHPVQMSQRVIVQRKRGKPRRGKRRG